MTDRNKDDGAALEVLFDAARAEAPQVPEALMARVLADAAAQQPAARGSAWRRLLAAFGGMPALGGLVAATCVGFWLGVAPPAGLPDLAGEILGEDAALDDTLGSPALSGFGWDIGEG